MLPPSGDDLTYARLGLGIRNYSGNTNSIRFVDRGYLTIEDSPLATTDAGWDPYIVKIGDTYFVLFSSASHSVHLASTQNLGIEWKYVCTVIHEKRENSCLSQYTICGACSSGCSTLGVMIFIHQKIS